MQASFWWFVAYYHRQACIASHVYRFLTGGDFIEVRINKEVRDYNESLFFGLTLRQCLFALLAIAVAVAAYFLLRGIVGEGQIGVVCILAAFPFALGGFFRYNGMTFEQFITAFIRSELLYPKRLVFKSDNNIACDISHISRLPL